MQRWTLMIMIRHHTSQLIEPGLTSFCVAAILWHSSHLQSPLGVSAKWACRADSRLWACPSSRSPTNKPISAERVSERYPQGQSSRPWVPMVICEARVGTCAGDTGRDTQLPTSIKDILKTLACAKKGHIVPDF